MDLYALMVVRTNSCKTRLERFKFDDIFRNFYGKDSSLEIRITFDILGDKEILPISVLNILYAQMFTPQISEAEAEEEDVSELCSVAACILAKKNSMLSTILGTDKLAEPCQSLAEGRFFSFLLPDAI